MANTSIQIKFSEANSAPTSLNIAEPAYSYTSNTLFIGTPDSSGAIAIGGKSYVDSTTAAFAKANAANVLAQAAYDAANSASATSIDTTARGTANAGFDKANTANVLAQAGFDKANTANVLAQSSFDKANTSNVTAEAAFSKANVANTTADASFVKANAANVLAQAAFDQANTKFATSGGTVSGDVTVSGNLVVVGQTVYANTQKVLINDNIITLNAAIDQAVSPTSNAGIEIDRGSSANASLIWDETNDKWVFSSDGTTYYGIADAGRLDSAFTQANSANVLAQAAFDAANSAGSNAVVTAAFNKANAANVLAQASFDKANTSNTTADAAFSKANTANTTADASFSKANTANVLAQAAFDKANTDATSITATAGVYGNATYVPVITLAANGRISSITNTAISGGGSSVGNVITLGTTTDGSLTNVGAYTGWTTSTYVTDAIDDLNEMMDNVRANTFVKSVSFTASPLAGGAGSVVTLTIVPVGTPNRYDVQWGDGSSNTTACTSTTIAHTYATNAGSPFTITVRAYNASGSGTGSESSNTSPSGYIIIYTSDPSVAFELYRNSTGGSSLQTANNTLYVTEGETFYLDNDTTNTTSGTTSYTANFGDGIANTTIASDSADGGVSGSRLSYSYGYTKSSNTTTSLVRLTMVSCSTANPTTNNSTVTKSLKVYDANIAAPANLSTKTITFQTSVGTSPNLCSAFANNTGGALTITAGNSVNRTVLTSGNIATVTMTTIAYTANTGTLSAHINGVDSGSKILTSGSNLGTNNSLTLVSESDYQLFDSTGTATSFATSIYSPGYFRGFKANVNTAASDIGVGVNNFQLRHSANGNTNIVEFVKDDITSAAITTAGTLTVGTANYRYISGIPYLNTAATIIMTGATVNNWIGQTYTGTTTPIQIVGGTLAESTSSMAISNTNFTYAQANGASNFLTVYNSVGVPIANTGKTSPYTLAALTSTVATGVRTVQQIGIRANNVFGTGATVENTTKLAVHSVAQSGISELAISVSGITGTYTDNGIRSAALLSATANTPAYTNTTNFFTTTTYSEASDPGVAGTKEATTRLGVIKYDATNYSTGYLPVGPNRSADTGTQFFTFAFRRSGVSSFDINITSASGILGCWVALPGTVTDASSSLNGWMRMDATKGGAGYPGVNAPGNGNDGCASTDTDRIQSGVALSGGYTVSFGTVNSSSAGTTGNVILIRLALTSGQSISALSIGAAA